MVLALLVLAGGLWVGVWLVRNAKTEYSGIVGLLMIAFCGFSALAALWRIVAGKPLFFSPRGLEFGSFGMRKHVQWSNIESTDIWRHRNQARNCLWLKDRDAIEGADDGGGMDVLGALNREMRVGDITFSWADRDRDAEEFDELLKLWIRRYGRSAD